MEENSSIGALPSLKPGGCMDEGSMTRSLRSSQEMRKDANFAKKLEQITEQLKAVQKKRVSLKKYNDGRVYGPKTDYSIIPKKFFSHPKLEFVYGEIMYSPYMTNPKDRYPQATYTMSETLKELKHKGLAFKDLPENERPYDDAKLKRQFIKEVCNYNPKFNVPKEKSSDNSLKRTSTANSSILGGRSFTGSSISSTRSMKDIKDVRANTGTRSKPESAQSGRDGKLNDVQSRRHASATSMSLDATSFEATKKSTKDKGRAASSTSTSTTKTSTKTSLNTTANNNTITVAKINKAISQAAEYATLNDTTTTSTQHASTGPEKEDNYEEDDFADPLELASNPVPPPPGSTEHDTDDPYEQDFESTGVIVPEKFASLPAPREAPDAYMEDFEAEGTDLEPVATTTTTTTTSGIAQPVEKSVVDEEYLQEEEFLTPVPVPVPGSGITAADHRADATIVVTPINQNKIPQIQIQASLSESIQSSAASDSPSLRTRAEEVTKDKDTDYAYAGDEFEPPVGDSDVVAEPTEKEAAGSSERQVTSADDAAVETAVQKPIVPVEVPVSDTVIDTVTDTVVVDTLAGGPGGSTRSAQAPIDSASSVQLRTDLIPTGTGTTTNNNNNSSCTTTTSADHHLPLQHSDTAQSSDSVHSEQSSASIQEEECGANPNPNPNPNYNHTFSPAAPSTVRSDLDVDMSTPFVPIGLSANGSADASAGASGSGSAIGSISGSQQTSSNRFVCIDDASSYHDHEEKSEEIFTEENTPKGAHASDPNHPPDKAFAFNNTVDVRSAQAPELVQAEEQNQEEEKEIVLEGFETIDTTADCLPSHSEPEPGELGEPLEEIFYQEHNNRAVKENVTVNNNYLHSPTKGEVTTETTSNKDPDSHRMPTDGEEGKAVEVEGASEDAAAEFELCSPARQPEAEIGEEIEG